MAETQPSTWSDFNFSTPRSDSNFSTPWLDPNFSTPWLDPNLSTQWSNPNFPTPWSDPNFSTPWSDLNFSTPYSDLNWIFFKTFQILSPSLLGMMSSTLSSGHDVIHTPALISSLGFIMTMMIVISFARERKLHQLTTHLNCKPE